MATNTDSDPFLGSLELGDHRLCKRKAVEDLKMAADKDKDTGVKLPRATRGKTELDDHRLKKRMEFEDRVRRVPRKISAWVKYALWERDFQRARSVWERALEVDYANHATWLKYAVMEMRNRLTNRAQSFFERTVALLPNVRQLWYRYSHMEQLLGNPAATREVLARWKMNKSSFETQIICERLELLKLC